MHWQSVSQRGLAIALAFGLSALLHDLLLRLPGIDTRAMIEAAAIGLTMVWFVADAMGRMQRVVAQVFWTRQVLDASTVVILTGASLAARGMFDDSRIVIGAAYVLTLAVVVANLRRRDHCQRDRE